MKKIFYKPQFLFTLLVLFCIGCKKGFLEVKPSTDIVNPITLEDFQGLLEGSYQFGSPALPTVSADEYIFKNYTAYQATRTLTERNACIWNKNIFGGEITGRNWSNPYSTIFLANNVIPGLAKLRGTEKEISKLNFLTGWALFIRALAYFDLVSNFSSPYDEGSANIDLGVPLKLNPSIDDIQPRATVKQVYDQIIKDLNTASSLLNANLEQLYRNHPTKVSSHALLARIYLSMRKYDQAELHADSSLRFYNRLIDYNTASPTATAPFNSTNDELIYFQRAVTDYGTNSLNNNTLITINPILLASYEANDLRPSLYFKKNTDGSFIMKLSYLGTQAISPFTGLATDELYLIKAECAARRNDLITSLKWLNDLLIKRYKTGSFVNLTAGSQIEVLNRVLLERRKELIWRNLRWSDLRRLNKEGANITLTRELNGVIYTLPPNDPRYVFPIPDNEISLSGIQQNQR